MKEIQNFHHVDLSINFSDFNAEAACGGGITECKDGGSYICLSPSDACPPGSCVGTSIKKVVEPLKARVLIRESELSQLKEALQNTILKFTKK